MRFHTALGATHGFGRSGVPDIVACVNGLFLAIETKAGGNKPTALQIREIETIRRNNGVAVVVDETNWDMVRDMVRVMALSITVVTEALRILRKFSRIRSNTTTDSLTE